MSERIVESVTLEPSNPEAPATDPKAEGAAPAGADPKTSAAAADGSSPATAADAQGDQADPKPPEVDASAAHAALSKRERAAVKREAELKEREARLGTALTEDALKAEAKKGPKAFLERFGLTVEDLAREYAGDEPVELTPEELAKKAALEAIDERTEAERKKAEQAEEKEFTDYVTLITSDQVRTAYRGRAKEELAKVAESHPVLASLGELGLDGAQQIFEAIALGDKAKGIKPRIATHAEVLKLAEEHYASRTGRTKPPVSPEVTQTADPEDLPTAPVKTGRTASLTNEDSPRSSGRVRVVESSGLDDAVNHLRSQGWA